MTDYLKAARAQPELDGVTHINTKPKANTQLGRILSPSYNTGDSILHPLLGPFRTVENLWCYLNTGGDRDDIRSVEPHAARNLVRLADKKYQCDKFKELLVDATLLKLRSNSYYENLMVENNLPFDHYYLTGVEKLPVRPTYINLYMSVLYDVQAILRGEKEHEFVRFKDMSFRRLD